MKLYRLLFPMAAVLLTGCSADEQPDNVKGLVPITLNTLMVEGNLTRSENVNIQSTQFDKNETFYAYFPEGVTATALETGSCTVCTTDGNGATTTDPQPYFNSGITSATVYAYYPYKDDKQVTNATTSFSVELNQHQVSGYNKSDLMYAKTTVTKSGATAEANLAFSHKMAKIIVNASAADGLTITDVRIVGGKRTINIVNPTTANEATSPFFGATPAYGDAASDLLSTTNYITMFTAPSTTANNTAVCAALLPPQTLSGAFIQIVTSEGTATYSVDKAIESGNSYTLNLSVTQSSIDHTTAISNWSNNNASTNAGQFVIGDIVDQIFRGVSLKPEPSVSYEGSILTKGRDYELYYSNNDVVGPAVVFVVGKGTYDGKSSSKIFTICYPMARDAIASDKGRLICTEGHIHTYNAQNTDADCVAERVAIITYLGATANSTYCHGLAIALTDANNGETCNWKNNSGSNVLDNEQQFTTKGNYTSEDGLLYQSNRNNDNWPAFKATASYDKDTPYGTSGWFLASAYQWGLMIDAAVSYSSLRDCFNACGGSNMKSSNDIYWTCSEYRADKVWCLKLGYSDFWHDSVGKGASTGTYTTGFVRSVLAF